jgi:tetratricopeptide (TPR) repeat protein
MTASQIDSTYKTATNFLLTGKLKQAFDKTRLLVQELQWGDVNDQFNDLLQNYRLMLQYFISGTEDPERKTIYNKIIARLIVINSKTREELMMRNATSFEYTQKRYYPHKLHFSTSGDLLDSLKYFHQQKQIITESEDYSNKEIKRMRGNFEKLLPDLFFIFWLNTRFEMSEKKVFQEILHPDYPGYTEKNLIISALTLNLWRMFDEEKLLLLIDICQHKDMQVRQRALVGLCFIMTRYNTYLPFFPVTRNRLMVLADDYKTVENLKNIIILIIGTTDTDRITKKMKEEILPEVMKISPMIKDKMDAENLLKSEEWDEENPEWNELLEQSGVADKLQELTELQMEGADVYMSTFSMLKNFPFFSETAHWFLPFDLEFSAVEELFENKDKTVLSAFLGNSAICNSDKYSFCLSVLQMPFSQREMMSRSFKAEAEQLEEITKDESLLKPDLAAKNMAKQYIQDLFRFFRIHPQHADFKDMFDLSLNLHQTTFFDMLSANSDLKTHAAEYYFTKKYYPQAIEIFSELIEETPPSSPLYQKIGFSYQKNSQITKALEAYIKADMLMPDDLWTVKKIALCHRLSGNYEKALEHYRHMDFLQPGKFNTKMQIANCLIALDKFKEALQVYAQLEQNDTENENLWRAISWCAFVSGNIHQAEYYNEKIISFTPNATDYLNAGHIAFCKKQRAKAIDYYRKSINEQKNNPELVISQIHNDKIHLKNNGIDVDEIPLLTDELLFLSE